MSKRSPKYTVLFHDTTNEGIKIFVEGKLVSTRKTGVVNIGYKLGDDPVRPGYPVFFKVKRAKSKPRKVSAAMQ